MARMERCRIFNQRTIAVSADKAWDYLIDWAGGNRQRPAGGVGELTLAKIELEGGMTDVPRTRVMEFGAHGTIRETVLHQDDRARTLYYNIVGVGPNGALNYLATTEVDAVDAESCQITITARYDLEPGADVTKTKALFDFAHNEGVIGAIERYFAATG